MLRRVPCVPGWPTAFRGSEAVAAGLTTWAVLQGPGFRRLHPDTYVAVAADPPALAVRCRAALRYVADFGVLAGYSAAELLGASCGPPDAPVELIVPHRGQRRPDGLHIRRERLMTDEVCEVEGLPVTTPVRTAFDLARRGGLVDRVVAVDALSNAHRFDPPQVLGLAERYRGARGTGGLAEVVDLADARSGSPMETRLRLLIVRAGLPRPEVQWPVQDQLTRTAVWLDLAYPEQRIGIEYDGGVHTRADTVLRDIGRHTALLDQGWRVYRYTKLDVRHRPDRIIAQLRRALRESRSTS
jgi:very-short-patch-repair endonuclease